MSGESAPPRTRFVIGSRESELAMKQTLHVQALLQAAHPGFTFDIQTSIASGDLELTKPLHELAAANRGLFTKELEIGLLSGAYDIAVHSLKDMPTTLPSGLTLAAITQRELPEDVLLVNGKHKGIGSLAALPSGSVIGTSSIRRMALLRRIRPDVSVVSVRGNLNTRLRKLDEGSADVTYDALILAAAGIRRLGWADRIEEVLDSTSFPYGVGQGALGIECRVDDEDVMKVLQCCVHEETSLVCKAERSFLRRLEGGCQVPIGVSCSLSGSTLTLHATVLSPDGATCIQDAESGDVSVVSAETIGVTLGERVLAAGADVLLGTGTRPVTYSTAQEGNE